MRAAFLLLGFALCGLGAQAQLSDGVLQDAIAAAMSKVLNSDSAHGQFLSAAHTTFTGVQQGLSQMSAAAATAYKNAGAQAEAALAAFEAQYCSPATFSPSEKVPATFVGHSMAITFDMGSCTFDDAKWIHDDIKELDCVEPSISYVKSPANFTSKYHSAPSFVSKECKVVKTFGEPVEKVLFVFDGQKAPDMNSLVAQITAEVKGVLSTVGSGISDVVSSAKTGLFGSKLSSGAAPAFNYS